MQQNSPSGVQHSGLIGGIGLTEVHVYAQRPAPDGLYSGCPHVHAITDEAYFILEGYGAVEFHDLVNGYRKMNLEPGQYVHFPPTVLHRLISNGQLVVLGMMGNAGLAERGEARIYFGADVDANLDHYRQLVNLPHEHGLEGALQRRDAAVAGYQELMMLWLHNRTAYFAELKRFICLHCAEMKQHAEEFAQQVIAGPMLSATATQERIQTLPAMSNVSPKVLINHRGDETAFGMCGILRPIKQLKSF